MKGLAKTEEEMQMVTIAQSMKEVGWIRFFFGGFVILVAALFIFIEMYITGACILVVALLLIGWCAKTVVDNNQKAVIHKSGLFSPFISTSKKSYEGATAVVLRTLTTRHKGFGQKIASNTTSYKIELEVPSGSINVDSLDEKKKANFYANEIAALLKIELKQVE